MRLVKIVIALIFCTAVVTGQTNRGAISGTVLDQNGAAVPGATVTITNLGTNQSSKVSTSGTGTFSVNSLEPVAYRVVVEAPGFKKSILESVKVDTASVASANVTLETGAVAETVTVSGEVPLISTETGTTSQTIGERQLRDLPLNNRSVLDLAVTAPNVTGDAGSEDPEVTSGQPVPGFNLNLNGGRSGSTAILADGVNNTGVGIARAVVSFTPETVQEFTVQTSAYSAEYGQTGGGVINVTTKSGTNRFNGTALWYTRNPITNAQPYRIGTTPRTPNNLRYTQASFTIGGPVYLPAFGEGGPVLYDGHDKTFFFFAYEPRWRQDFVNQTTLFPTAAERAGDFRNLIRTNSGWLPASVVAQFAGQNANAVASVGPSAIYQQYTINNGRLVPIVLSGGRWFCQFGATAAQGMVLVNGQPQCPANTPVVDSLNVIPQSFIDPIAAKLIQFQPTGTGYFLDNGAVRNAVLDRQVTQNETRYTLRLDHQLTKSNHMNFRYTVTPAIGVRNFGSDVNGSTGVFSDAKQILLGDDHTFAPTVVNSLKLNYTRGVFSEDFAPEFSINGGRNLATELGIPSVTSGGIPLFQISLDGASSYNAFADIGSSGSTNNFNVEERFNINDVLYWTHGNMTWKFGVDLSRARLNVVPFFGASGGRWEFRTLNTDRTRANNVAAGGNSLASLLIGVPNQVQVRPLLVNYDYRWDAYAGFVQNDWRVRPNLTLNLGLRYSLQLPRTEKNDLQGVFRLDKTQTVTLTDAQRRAMASGTGGLGIPTTDPIPSYVPTKAVIPAFAFAGRGGNSRYLVPVDKLDFEPRFGFAWTPRLWKWGENRGFVVRGGYGIAHQAITGNNRAPNPDFFSFQAAATGANGSTAGFTADPTQPVSLSHNPPLGSAGDIIAKLNINPDGLNFANSIAMSGFVFPGDNAGKIPYVQNWNLSFSMEILKNTVVEAAYVGNKGTHLYMPLTNVNPRDPNFVDQLEVNNLNAEGTLADPLGRVSLVGAAVQITRASILSPFLGFGNLNKYLDPSVNSIRHAMYVQVQRRFAKGYQFSVNYTYGKSIDDASDASPDVRVLTTGTTLGQVYYGATRASDRSVSIFDIKHNLTSTFLWDLPFGKKGAYFKDAPKIVDGIIGGWTLSGVIRFQGGQPFTPFITDTNRLGGVNRSVRLNIVEGVPLKNPLYSKDCTIGAGCEPYINPAAFMRPPKGSLGNSPRTLDVRAPMQQYFDLSVQKSFDLPFIGEEGRRRINFRVDLINAFNHPTFRYNNTGNTPFGFGVLPNEALLVQNDLTSWLAANPGQTATLAQVNALLDNNRLPVPPGSPPGTVGALPLDFFSVRIPQGFATRTANSFDIRTLEGLKLYRARQAYDANFGTLFANNNPRYIQFGIRVFF
jgi:outer membrane receptor protein involved in Fe transport